MPKLPEVDQERLREELEVKRVADRVGRFLTLYHLSLQGLVDGYRETTMDPTFVHPDGKTSQEKKEAFEAKLKEWGTGQVERIKEKIK